MVFWFVCGALALCASGLLALAMLRGAEQSAPDVHHDMSVYKDQLAEVDRDLARGVLDVPDAERARIEISRRILALDTAQQAVLPRSASRKGTGVLAGVLAVLLVGGGLALYQHLGAPGYADLPRQARIEAAEERHKTRMTQDEAEAALPAPAPKPEISLEYQTLLTQLRTAVAERPDDLEGAKLLARHEMATGHVRAAYLAQRQVIRLKGDAATAEDFATYADMLIVAAGGFVSPEAEAALRVALASDPKEGSARYYVGLLALQIGRPDAAFSRWAALLKESPADAPWVASIRAQIEDLAYFAGVDDYELPPLARETRGPSAADVEAAGEMSAEDRMTMIRGMVSGLSDRLATEGGPPSDWARLIGALGVLGDTQQARAIYGEAKQVFGADPEALNMLAAAAERAGIAP